MNVEFQVQRLAAEAADQGLGLDGSSKSSGDFSGVLERLVGEVDSLAKDSTAKLEGFVEGRVENVHDVMLAMTRADLSFRMMLEVRNRLVDAYHEVMRVQP